MGLTAVHLALPPQRFCRSLPTLHALLLEDRTCLLLSLPASNLAYLRLFASPPWLPLWLRPLHYLPVAKPRQRPLLPLNRLPQRNQLPRLLLQPCRLTPAQLQRLRHQRPCSWPTLLACKP
jgi:hypothetical protein